MRSQSHRQASATTLRKTPLVALALVLAALVPAGCSGDGGPLSSGVVTEEGPNCVVNKALFYRAGVGKDGIPALTDPLFVGSDDPRAEYLLPHDRVISLTLDSLDLAIPHNILWWHEIVNLNLPGLKTAVTYCPLTGSSLAFDRAAIAGAEFGVSGLLFLNNLVMYDRRSLESLWPQLMSEAACGPEKSQVLPRVPVKEMTWARWRELHPEGRVVADETGFDRDYNLYPYGSYEDLHEKPFVPIGGDSDPRRPPKERVLGIRGGDGGGLAFPFLALEEKGAVWAGNTEVDGTRYAVFWDSAGQAAMAYDPVPFAPLDSPVDPTEPLTFEVRDGRIVDRETGTVWSPYGRGVEGPLGGSTLLPSPDAYVAFWFAWSGFQPDTGLWTG